MNDKLDKAVKDAVILAFIKSLTKDPDPQMQALGYQLFKEYEEKELTKAS